MASSEHQWHHQNTSGIIRTRQMIHEGEPAGAHAASNQLMIGGAPGNIVHTVSLLPSSSCQKREPLLHTLARPHALINPIATAS